MYDGGYYLIRQPLLRGGIHKHTAACPDAIPDRMLEAVNVVQGTRWRINVWLLDLMRECWTEGDGLGIMPRPYDEPTPPRVEADIWEGMSQEERATWKHNASAIHIRNNQQRAGRESLLRRLTLAESYRSEEAIWFPHFLDFRGRFYPIPQDLHPQGDDTARGLLMFADGLPLGAAGVSWLSIRLANSYGMDKLSFDARHAWVIENERLILDSARNPLDGERWWTEADEPWSFLATCREWELAHRLPDPTQFVSHLPIPLDGTCNGMQHLSLLGRDPIGAKATCCSADSKRYDLYTEVANIVTKIVEEDAKCGDEFALNWMGRVTRKTVKRAVMTTPLTP